MRDSDWHVVGLCLTVANISDMLVDFDEICYGKFMLILDIL
jgi:hypothetical protein